jgi:hypothetical protein
MPPKTSPVSPLPRTLAAAGLALALLGAGCHNRQNVDQMTQAVESGERPVAMAGSEAFFGGKVVVRVTVSRGIGHGYKRTKATLLSGPTGFNATNELTKQDEANEIEAKEAYADYMKARPNIGTPLPPVTLHLILINPGAEPLKIAMIDFSSDLGNFVVDPDSLTVAPGESGEATPMVSQLGVSSDLIPVTVTLKLGASKETRVVQVRSLLDESGKPKAAP